MVQTYFYDCAEIERRRMSTWDQQRLFPLSWSSIALWITWGHWQNLFKLCCWNIPPLVARRMVWVNSQLDFSSNTIRPGWVIKQDQEKVKNRCWSQAFIPSFLILDLKDQGFEILQLEQLGTTGISPLNQQRLWRNWLTKSPLMLWGYSSCNLLYTKQQDFRKCVCEWRVSS